MYSMVCLLWKYKTMYFLKTNKKPGYQDTCQTVNKAVFEKNEEQKNKKQEPVATFGKGERTRIVGNGQNVP